MKLIKLFIFIFVINIFSKQIVDTENLTFSFNDGDNTISSITPKGDTSFTITSNLNPITIQSVSVPTPIITQPIVAAPTSPIQPAISIPPIITQPIVAVPTSPIQPAISISPVVTQPIVAVPTSPIQPAISSNPTAIIAKTPIINDTVNIK